MSDIAMTVEGTVLAEHKCGFFDVEIPSLKRKVLAKKAGKLIKAKIRLVAGELCGGREAVRRVFRPSTTAPAATPAKCQRRFSPSEARMGGHMGALSESAHPVPAQSPATSVERPARTDLSDSELRDRLALSAPALVKEVYDLVNGQIAEENGRQARLDAKATSLLTAAGLSLTVAFSFGLPLVIARQKSGPDPHFPTWAIGAFSFALFAGLVAAGLAMWALLVRGAYKAVDEQAIFDRRLLEYEDLYDPKEEGTDEKAVTEYRKLLIPHLWVIAREHLNVHQKKAGIIKAGQVAFLLFIVAIMVVCESLVMKTIL